MKEAEEQRRKASKDKKMEDESVNANEAEVLSQPPV